MSFRTKRSAAPSGPMGYNKSRLVGGKVLKYRATAPLSGSFRARQAAMGELKNSDLSAIGNMTTASTGQEWGGVLNGIATGPATNERIGRRITMKSLWIRYAFTMNASSAGASPFRILIVYDKQTNGGAQPAVTTVLQANNINGFKNLANERRFTTIMDEYVQAIGTGGPQSIIGQRYIKMNLEAEYGGVDASTASINTGALWVWVFQNGGITTAGPALNFQARLRYCE